MPKITKAMRLKEGATQLPGANNYRCQQCGLCNQSTYGTFVEPESSNDNPPVGKILVVHGSPWEPGSLTEAGYSTGYAGSLIKQMILKKLNLRPSQIIFTGVTRCRLVGKLKTGYIDLCSPFLRHEVIRHAPTHIIGLGAHAVRSITGDKDATLTPWLRKTYEYRTSEISTIPCMFTYSPTLSMDGKTFGVLDIIVNQIRDFLYNTVKPQLFRPLEVL